MFGLLVPQPSNWLESLVSESEMTYYVCGGMLTAVTHQRRVVLLISFIIIQTAAQYTG